MPDTNDLQPITEGQVIGNAKSTTIEKKSNLADLVQPQPQNSLIENLMLFDQFAETILKTEYANNYKKNVKDPVTGEVSTIIAKEDIIASLLIGQEIGIKPMGCLALGKNLNAKSYFSVLKGRELGLDPITSISKIYNISTSNGDVLALAVDIINKTIIENSQRVELIRDYELVPMYYVLNTNVYVGHKYNVVDEKGILKSNYFIYKNGMKPEEVAANLSKIIIQATGYTHVTSLRIVTNIKDTTYHYSIQEAIDAGLYMGYHSTLKDAKGNPLYVSGKSNWNNHPATMLRNRVTSIGGRDSVPHKLQGSYSHEEVAEFTNAIVIE